PHMKRREFITLLGGAAAWPLAARSQQSKVDRLAYLEPATPTDPVAANLRRQFLLGLRDLGYVEGSVHGRPHSGPEASVRAWPTDWRSGLDHHPAPLGLESRRLPAGRRLRARVYLPDFAQPVCDAYITNSGKIFDGGRGRF